MRTFSRIVGLFTRFILFLVIMAAPAYVLLSNFAVFEPYLYPLHLLQGNVRYASRHIIVGHYPDYGLLVDLRKRGVKTIISLLDPKLIYEKSLINREDKLASTLGIKEYNFPMNSSQPSTSALNSRALRNIQKIIDRNPHALIYIHCYLGKHRVGDVVDMLKHEKTYATSDQRHHLAKLKSSQILQEDN